MALFIGSAALGIYEAAQPSNTKINDYITSHASTVTGKPAPVTVHKTPWWKIGDPIYLGTGGQYSVGDAIDAPGQVIDRGVDAVVQIEKGAGDALGNVLGSPGTLMLLGIGALVLMGR